MVEEDIFSPVHQINSLVAKQFWDFHEGRDVDCDGRKT